MDDQDRCERRGLLASCGRAMASEGKCHLRTRLELGGLGVTKGPAIGTGDSETSLAHLLGGFQGQHPQWAIRLALPLLPPSPTSTISPRPPALAGGLRSRQGVPAAPSHLPLRSARRDVSSWAGVASWILPWSWVGGVGTRGSGMGRQRPHRDGTGAPRLHEAALSPAPSSG